MSLYRSRKMQPRNGHTLVALIPARISGCQSQREMSLDDQVENAKETIAELYDGPVETRVIATKGKGEDLSRPELAEIEAMIRTGELDVLVAEDLGRLVRGAAAVKLCGIAVDHGTRVITVNDCIDTDEDSWEEDVIAASRDHVGHNVHTSKRLKKKMMIRFKRNGESIPLPIAGYCKPEDGKSFHDWEVDEQYRGLIVEGAKRLSESLNCSAVADYFNESGFPTGPYCRNSTWNGAMVRRFFANPLLKGKPERGNRHCVKHHETGRRKSVKNPEGPVAIEMPHLKILSDVEFDALNARLAERNSRMGRKSGQKADDPLKGMPRKRTRFPGQHARCWYCGRKYVWGGNGMKENLQCTGSRNWQCWNSIGVNGRRVCETVVACIISMLESLDGFAEEFRRIVEKEAEQPLEDHQAKLRQIESEQRTIEKERQNLLDSMAKFGAEDWIGEKLNDLKSRAGRLAMQKQEICRSAETPFVLPESPAELSKLLQEEFLQLAIDSYEFGEMLPRIVPEIYIYCVRACDGGPLLPRAKVIVDLTGAFESPAPEKLQELLRREFTVDLFDDPKTIVAVPKAVELRTQNLTIKQIAAELSVSERVVSKALSLDQWMTERGLDDPYIFQVAPPEDLKKLRRHRHPRYRFQMVEGYHPPEL